MSLFWKILKLDLPVLYTNIPVFWKKGMQGDKPLIKTFLWGKRFWQTSAKRPLVLSSLSTRS